METFFVAFAYGDLFLWLSLWLVSVVVSDVSDACLYVIVIATIYVRVVSSPSEAMAGGRGSETS